MTGCQYLTSHLSSQRARSRANTPCQGLTNPFSSGSAAGMSLPKTAVHLIKTIRVGLRQIPAPGSTGSFKLDRKQAKPVIYSLLSFWQLSYLTICAIMIELRSVAQLVEQRSPKPLAEGSSPSTPASGRDGGMADTLA